MNKYHFICINWIQDIENTQVILPEVNKGMESTSGMSPRLLQSSNVKDLMVSSEDLVDSSSSTLIKKKVIEYDEKPGRNRTKHARKLEKRNNSSGSDENGVLCIGGMRIYTEKSKDWYEDDDDVDIGGRGKSSSGRFNWRSSRRMKYKPKYHSVENDMEDLDGSENFSSSDIDDDIAEDYIAGIDGDFMEGDLFLQTPVIHQVPIENMDISFASEYTPELSDDDTYSGESTESDGEISQEASKDHICAVKGEESDINFDVLKLECSTDESEVSTYDLDPQDMILGKRAKVGNMKQGKKNSAQLQLMQQRSFVRKKIKPSGMLSIET